MHVVIVFINIGFYHAARLLAAAEACERQQWQLTALQLTDDTLDHPWGSMDGKDDLRVETLVRAGASAGKRELPVVDDQTVAACLNRLKPDVVFLPGWSFRLCVQIAHWCRSHGVPLVAMSESKRDDEKRTWWREQLKSWLYVRKFSGALVGGDVHADYAASLGIPRERIFKGYDAVDNDHFAKSAAKARRDESDVRARIGRIPPRPYFIAVSRLIARKNFRRLLEAYRLYRARTLEQQPWDLVICGNGDERAALEHFVHEHRLREFVHFPGFLPYTEVGFWYGLASAFIHPALVEPWGLVVNEACAAGLPILCSKTVGARYDLVREGENGYLFDPRNTEEMVARMEDMHTIGDGARRSMGDGSRRLAGICAPQVFGAAVVAAARAVAS